MTRGLMNGVGTRIIVFCVIPAKTAGGRTLAYSLAGPKQEVSSKSATGAFCVATSPRKRSILAENTDRSPHRTRRTHFFWRPVLARRATNRTRLRILAGMTQNAPGAAPVPARLVDNHDLGNNQITKVFISINGNGIHGLRTKPHTSP